MRLFVGLRPSVEFRAALSVLQSRLQAAGVAARYLDPSNLHLTLAFIGEWPGNVSAVLPPVEQPFTLTLSGVGLFPEAKVIWAGVQKSPALDRLAQQVREKLTAADIPFDPKPFVPHITLGRKPVVPETVDLSGIMIPPAEMTIEDVFLYKSERGENGMVYSVIGSSTEKQHWRKQSMSKYVDLAMERRNQFTPEGKPAWNCCQTVASVFAKDAGYDEDSCMKAATFFRGGMQMGSVCGAITGSLIALGMAGIDDPQVSNELIRKVRDHHNGMIHCADLLRINAQNGREKMPHCNAMIRECIGYAEEAMRAKGKLKPEGLNEPGLDMEADKP